MKRLLAALLAALVLTGCAGGTGEPSSSAAGVRLDSRQSVSGSAADNDTAGETDAEGALAISLEHADVPAQDAYNTKVERDGDHGVAVWKVEFETDYGDYDFEVTVAGGAIVDADYEVDEDWLGRLGGSPVDADGAKEIAAAKVPGADPADITVTTEDGDGRSRYEGRFSVDGIVYEFEIDSATGRIFDWNADLRD